MCPTSFRRRPLLCRERKRHLRVTSGAALLSSLLAFAATGSAQVSCANPDNLCTGDPCVIPTLAVATPCTVDFGSRTLVIAGRLSVPVQGVLSFTAGSVQVTGRVIGVGGAATGQTPIALTLAATGDVDVQGPIKLTSRAFRGDARGTILLDAGRDVLVGARIGTAGSREAGNVRIEADRDISVGKPIKTSSTANAGDIRLTAGRDIAVRAALNGAAGGAPEAETANIEIEAGGTLSVSARIRASALGVEATGGSAVLRGAAGVTVDGSINCRGARAPGGGVTIESSGGSVTINRSVTITGRDGDGFVQITAAGDITQNAALLADVFNLAGHGGGSIGIESTLGNVTLNERIVALAIAVSTPGAVAVNAEINLHHGYSSGRQADITGGSVQVTADATINVDADPSLYATAGYITLSATAGDLVLAGTFLAGENDGFGRIIADATGNIIASGRFKAMPAGCIAFTAAGTIDTTGGEFDTPISSSCS